MPRWLMFLIFFAISILILGGVHYYFYRRLVVATAIPSPWRTVLGVMLIIFTLSFPLSFVLMRTLDLAFARLILYPVYIWLGFMVILFFVLLGKDLVYSFVLIAGRLAGRSIIGDAQQKILIARWLAGAVFGTGLILSSLALWQGLSQLRIKRVEVVLPNLPAKLDGFSIAQLTDTHLGAMRGNDWFRGVVAKTNQLGADLIAITGDLADATPEQMAAEVKMLASLKAPQGVFFVTGNHEYFHDLNGWLKQLDDIGIRVLRNERVSIHKDGASFDLAGVDDQQGKRLAPGNGTDVAKAIEGRDPSKAIVLLAHQPRTVDQASEHGVGLVISGHTHAGQIWPWTYFVYLQQPYICGLNDHKGTQVYISQGTGFWGPPMRLGTTSEISLIVLRSPELGEAPTKQ